VQEERETVEKVYSVETLFKHEFVLIQYSTCLALAGVIFK
jgi:hypothetical protein